jgi:Glycosyltransferase Family 4
LRVALLAPPGERSPQALADRLAEDGHDPRVIAGSPSALLRPLEARLAQRRCEEGLSRVPIGYLALVRGDDELAHAFSLADALAAARWAARTGRPAVYSHAGVPHHAALTARRFRLRYMERVCRVCTVVAESPAAAEAFKRWLGVDACVIEPGATGEHLELYERLLRG